MPFEPRVRRTLRFEPPALIPSITFDTVLNKRRSAIGDAVSWQQISDLLWHSSRIQGSGGIGRAGQPVYFTASPSAGGLGIVRIVCIMDGDIGPALYDPHAHAFLELDIDAGMVRESNRVRIREILGTDVGCTLRLVADWQRLQAAYENGESLMFRDSGHLGATIGLCAAWLSLAACPIGFIGDDLVEPLGFQSGVTRAAGAVQIGALSE